MKRPRKTLAEKRAAFRPVLSTKYHKSNCPKFLKKKCPLKVLWNALEKLWEKKRAAFRPVLSKNIINRIAQKFLKKKCPLKVLWNALEKLWEKTGSISPCFIKKYHTSNCPKIKKNVPSKSYETPWKNSGKKTGSISPCFIKKYHKSICPKIFLPKIFFSPKNILGKSACPWSPRRRIRMRDVPPRPTPFPLPSKPRTFGPFVRGKDGGG